MKVTVIALAFAFDAGIPTRLRWPPYGMPII